MKFWKQFKDLWSGPLSIPLPDLQEAAADTAPNQGAYRPTHADTAGRQKKPILQNFVKPTLYFSGWGYDERNGNHYFREQGKQAVKIEAGGQVFALRQLIPHFVFRQQGDSDERAALLIAQEPERKWPYNLADIPEADFAQIVTEGKYGRCLLYVADCMQPKQCAYLAFLPDGSGMAQDEFHSRMGSFHWREATDLDWTMLLTADPEELRPLCQKLFATQINPRALNPYLDAATFQQIPHRFLIGSEEELRRITAAIVQTEPGLFENSREPVTITYRAQLPAKRAGMTRAEQGKTGLMRGRLTSLCDLALRLNTFVGVEWKPRIPNPNRLSHWERNNHKIRVAVQPPSAHERAESLLVLANWLEGKVRKPKRLRLLGIEEE